MVTVTVTVMIVPFLLTDITRHFPEGSLWEEINLGEEENKPLIIHHNILEKETDLVGACLQWGN